VAESYDELKVEHEKLVQERDKDRKIIQALKDQVIKLKQIISAKNLDQSLCDMDQQTLIESLTTENNFLKGVQKEKEVLENEVVQ